MFSDAARFGAVLPIAGGHLYAVGIAPDDITHCSHRKPYPTLHLL